MSKMKKKGFEIVDDSRAVFETTSLSPFVMILKGEGKKKIEKKKMKLCLKLSRKSKPETDKPKTYLGLPKHKSIADSNKRG